MQAGLTGPAAASSPGHGSLSHRSQPLPARQHTGKHGWGCGHTTLLPPTPPHPWGSHSMPWLDSSARWWYLLAKCSILECVSACGNIGEEAGLKETHTGQQGLAVLPQS